MRARTGTPIRGRMNDVELNVGRLARASCRERPDTTVRPDRLLLPEEVAADATDSRPSRILDDDASGSLP